MVESATEGGSESRDVWSVQRAVAWVAADLGRLGIHSPRLEAELLVGHVLGLSRLQVYLRFEQPLTAEERRALRHALRRRRSREPLAYILGEKEFFGRPFAVNPAVLVPRPETEELVALAVAHLSACAAPQVLDVGSGSGAIAVTIACEVPNAEVHALEPSAAAADTLVHNAQRHSVAASVIVHRAGVEAFGDAERSFDAVLANLPYLRRGEVASLAPELAFEPLMALEAGADGLDVYRLLAGALADGRIRLAPGALVLLEMAPDQGEILVGLLEQTCPRLAQGEVLRDGSGRPRFVSWRLPDRSAE